MKLLSDTSSKSVDAMMYHHMIVSLMYMTNMRPNICFAVNTLNQFLIDVRQVYLIAVKYILRYLKGTVDYGLKYDANQNINLHGYVDSDWAVLPPFTHLGHVAEIFKPLGVSLVESLESRLSPCS